MTGLLAVLAAASALAAPPLERAPAIGRDVGARYAFAVSDVGSTAVVASIELLPARRSPGRSVATRDGVHFTICGVVASRCARAAARDNGLVARRQALELALRTFLETRAPLVTVFVPAPRGPQLVVFEREPMLASVSAARLLRVLARQRPGDIVRTPLGLAVERLTRPRTYVPAGLATSGADDVLLARPVYARG